MQDDDSSLYDNILKASDNLQDITFARYGTVIQVNNDKATVKEENTTLQHENCLLLTKSVKVGDKVVLGFVDNSIHNPYIIGVLGGTNTGNGGGGSLVGTFYISDDGHLHVKLPKNTSNPYYIDNNGHLHYTTCDRGD